MGHVAISANLSPRVTVLIPSFNAAATLTSAVESVLDQTLRDVEVLVIDDASSDATAAVVGALAARDSRVRGLRNVENQGKSISMNRGIDAALGKWIAVLDADDRFVPDRLEHLLALGEAEGVDMVADNQFFIDVLADEVVGTAWPVGEAARRLDLETFLARSSAYAPFSFGMLKPIFRTDFLRRTGLRYEPDARNGQDFFKLLQFYLYRGTAIVSDRPLYLYSQPFGSKSQKWSHAARKRYDFCQVHAINERFVARARGLLTPAQLAMLERRSAQLRTLANFWTIRENVSGGHVADAMFNAVRYPAATRLALQRASTKLRLRMAS